MVAVTLSTQENKIALFLKSVLTHNLTDPNSVARGSKPFVFKDAPEEEQTIFPYIIVEYDTGTDSSPVLDNSKTIAGLRTITIRIISKGTSAIQRRDDLADAIISTLLTPSSHDMDGVSIAQNNISIRNINIMNNDVMNTDGEIIRVKELSAELRYYGA